MSTLLEFREKLKLLYSRSEFLLSPVGKFLQAYLLICMVNGKLGYMATIDNLGLVLVASLTCSFLPNGFALFFAAIFSLAHFYTLSIEVALVALILYLILFLMFVRFVGEHSKSMIWTIVLMAMKIPYAIPVVIGLLAGPMAGLAVGCGIVVFYFVNNIAMNAAMIGNMGDSEAISKVKIAIDGLIGNKAMIVMIIAFAITITVVYLIRRLSVEHAWTIAMITGAIVDLVILLAGDLIYDTNLTLGYAILGTVIALVAAKIVEFFRFCVDYSRTEKVQFEDDEYYYYVKAIPKMNVTAASRSVKKINSQRTQPSRKVETERTAQKRSNSGYDKTEVRGKSVTIGNQDDAYDSYDEYDSYDDFDEYDEED